MKKITTEQEYETFRLMIGIQEQWLEEDQERLNLREEILDEFIELIKEWQDQETGDDKYQEQVDRQGHL